MASEPIRNWRDLLDRYRDFRSGEWCFRGDRATPGFKTSLERASIDRWGRNWSEMPDIENGLLRRFKREAHLYLTSQPDEDDIIGWLALMRHHGAPTRLLDWTYSFFVAVYFAISRSGTGEQPRLGHESRNPSWKIWKRWTLPRNSSLRSPCHRPGNSFRRRRKNCSR